MILYINACVRQDSRTQRLAEALLKQMADVEAILQQCIEREII